MAINGYLRTVEIRVKDPDPEWQDDKWDDIYRAVELTDVDPVVSSGSPISPKWAINPGYTSFVVYEEEIDHYIELLTAIKNYNKEEEDK